MPLTSRLPSASGQCPVELDGWILLNRLLPHLNLCGVSSGGEIVTSTLSPPQSIQWGRDYYKC